MAPALYAQTYALNAVRKGWELPRVALSLRTRADQLYGLAYSAHDPRNLCDAGYYCRQIADEIEAKGRIVDRIILEKVHAE